MHVSDRYLLPQVIPACVTGAGRPSSSQCHRRHTLAPLRSLTNHNYNHFCLLLLRRSTYIPRISSHSTPHHTTPPPQHHTELRACQPWYPRPPPNNSLRRPEEPPRNPPHRNIREAPANSQTLNSRGQNSKCEPQVRSLGGMARERYCTKSHVGWLDATAARRGVAHDGR